MALIERGVRIEKALDTEVLHMWTDRGTARRPEVDRVTIGETPKNITTRADVPIKLEHTHTSGRGWLHGEQYWEDANAANLRKPALRRGDRVTKTEGQHPGLRWNGDRVTIRRRSNGEVEDIRIERHVGWLRGGIREVVETTTPPPAKR